MKRVVGGAVTLCLATGHGVATALDADDLASVLGPGAVVALVVWLVACLAGVVRGFRPEPFRWQRRRSLAR